MKRGRILSTTRQSQRVVGNMHIAVWRAGVSMTEQLREEREQIEAYEARHREQEEAQRRRIATYKRRKRP